MFKLCVKLIKRNYKNSTYFEDSTKCLSPSLVNVIVKHVTEISLEKKKGAFLLYNLETQSLVRKI